MLDKRLRELLDKEPYTFVSTLPAWSLPALMNGDYSGLSEHEAELVRKFDYSLVSSDKRVNHYVVEVSEHSETYFAYENDLHSKGDDVIDCKITIVYMTELQVLSDII